MKDYLNNISIEVTIEKQKQRLKFAVWEQMEFLSEEIGIDNPEKVIDTIRDCVEEYFAEYSPKDETFEGEFDD